MKGQMMKIFNVNVYGLKESMKASGYPMISTEIKDMVDPAVGLQVSRDDYKRCVNLGIVPSGTGHDNFLKGIIVQFDITYPVYWSPQFQRYNFADIVSSTSAMHRINKIDLDESTNKYVSRSNNQRLKAWIAMYNDMLSNKKDSVVIKGCPKDDLEFVCYYTFNMSDLDKISNMQRLQNIEDRTGIKDYNVIKYLADTIVDKDMLPPNYKSPEAFKTMSAYEVYMTIISNAPQGLMKTMRISTNYLQLKSMFLQRRYHKLKEDWGYFCDWAITLPYFKEFALKGHAVEHITKYLNMMKPLPGKEIPDKYNFNLDGVDGKFHEILDYISHKFLSTTPDIEDVNIHVLYKQNEIPTQVECFMAKDENGDQFVLVYPTDIKSKRLLDLDLEIIENFIEKNKNGYFFKVKENETRICDRGIDEYLERIKNNTGKLERYRFSKTHNSPNWNQYVLTMIVNSFTLSANRINDTDVHVLFAPNTDLLEVNYMVVKEEDKEFVLVYQADVLKNNPQDINIEVIKGFNTAVANGYNFEKVISTK